MGRAHVVAIPYPAQGHVIPMMELAQCLAKNGVRVTFVNTESNHRRVVEALPMQMEELLDLVSVPDGLDCWEDRMDFAKSVEALGRVMPPELQALIQSINATQTDAVTCIVTDVFMAGITQAYESFRLIKRAAFLPAAAALLALTTSADKLVDDGIIDTNGTPLQSEPIRLSPSMPAMNPNHFAWLCLPDLASRKLIFQSVVDNNKSAKLADFLICNSSSALEPAALGFLGNCRPIGPLLGRQAGHFWPENPTCLSWLDRQPPSSVVYVAFGSFTLLDPVQFRELALGLELTGMPFLWVVRRDVAEAEGPYPDGFEERVRGRGKTVGWAPQQRVLAHPAVACFVTHCGWNSTVESISSGVPVLCWPYFTDQFLNETYVVDEWGVGVRLERDGGGVIGREEIRRKVEVVLGDGGYKKRMVELQGKTLATSAEGGSSHANLCDFIDWIKEE